MYSSLPLSGRFHRETDIVLYNLAAYELALLTKNPPEYSLLLLPKGWALRWKTMYPLLKLVDRDGVILRENLYTNNRSSEYLWPRLYYCSVSASGLNWSESLCRWVGMAQLNSTVRFSSRPSPNQLSPCWSRCSAERCRGARRAAAFARTARSCGRGPKPSAAEQFRVHLCPQEESREQRDACCIALRSGDESTEHDSSAVVVRWGLIAAVWLSVGRRGGERHIPDRDTVWLLPRFRKKHEKEEKQRSLLLITASLVRCKCHGEVRASEVVGCEVTRLCQFDASQRLHSARCWCEEDNDNRRTRWKMTRNAVVRDAQ